MKLNESIYSMYQRWADVGNRRKEEGTKVETPYGDMYLNNVHINYESIIENFLDFDFTQINIYNIRYGGYSKEEQKDIANGKFFPYICLLNDNRDGDTIECMSYEDYYENVDDEEISEHDYKEICSVFVTYFKNNMDVEKKPRGYDYCFVLGSTDTDYDFYDELEESFDIEFPTTSFEVFSYNGYNYIIGCEINFNNFKHYKEMKSFVQNFLDNIDEE